jgi:hypothetical protein
MKIGWAFFALVLIGVIVYGLNRGGTLGQKYYPTWMAVLGSNANIYSLAA